MTQAGDTGRAGIPDIVVVGAACRDIDESDPRGWRLGGGVTYGALACARLGIRTGVLLGVDAIATDAWEIDLLVDAGVDIIRVPLPTGPVFINHERPEGRIQTSLDPGSQLPVEAVPPAWRAAPAWMLALVANELSDAWAGQPSTDSCGCSWQGSASGICRPDRRRSWPVQTSWASAGTISRGTWCGPRSWTGCARERRCS
jgi:hypothetical protein